MADSFDFVCSLTLSINIRTFFHINHWPPQGWIAQALASRFGGWEEGLGHLLTVMFQTITSGTNKIQL